MMNLLYVLRPVGESLNEQFDMSDTNRILRPRLGFVSRGMRETREAYELIGRILGVQLRRACDGGPIVVKYMQDGVQKTCKVKVVGGAPRGDFHAHQGLHGKALVVKPFIRRPVYFRNDSL
jgi:hypothetical protein